MDEGKPLIGFGPQIKKAEIKLKRGGKPRTSTEPVSLGSFKKRVTSLKPGQVIIQSNPPVELGLLMPKQSGPPVEPLDNEDREMILELARDRAIRRFLRCVPYDTNYRVRFYRLPLPPDVTAAMGRVQNRLIFKLLRDVPASRRRAVLHFAPDDITGTVDFEFTEDYENDPDNPANIITRRKTDARGCPLKERVVWGLPMLLLPIQLVTETEGMPVAKRAVMVSELWYQHTKRRWHGLIETNLQELRVEPANPEGMIEILTKERRYDELVRKEVGDSDVKIMLRQGRAEGYTDNEMAELFQVIGKPVKESSIRSDRHRTRKNRQRYK